MSYDFIRQIFTNNILKHIEISIQKCSKLVVQNPEKQAKTQVHNSYIAQTVFCRTRSFTKHFLMAYSVNR